MASVTAETKNGRTSYRITWQDGDKRRRRIRVGGICKKDAAEIATKVQAIVGCHISGRPLDTATALWIARLGDDLHSKLADAGLTESRQRTTLGVFIDAYVANRHDAAANTVRNWINSRGKLIDFFGEDCDLRSITVRQADDWRQSLVNGGWSDSTVSKAVKHAKQFLATAVRKGYVEENPFQELRAGGERNDERKQFVDRATISRVLDACPSDEWRLIVVLARYGGLRCPSELLALTWGDIDLAGGRLTVTSRKTKRHGKGTRVIPLFPELEPYLSAAFAAAPDGTRFVISRYRNADGVNLRTQLLRIIRRASVVPWERLFHNLRASRHTELENQFPSHVFCHWMGNSESVASKHYLQVTDQHLAAAVQGGATGGAAGGAANDGNGSQATETVPHFCPTFPGTSLFSWENAGPEYPLGDEN